jgi:hypothetical protein
MIAHKTQQDEDVINSFCAIPPCDGDGDGPSVYVTNPFVTLPSQDLELFPNFVTKKESKDILDEVYSTYSHKFIWEGFESRKRVLRFSLTDDVDYDDDYDDDDDADDDDDDHDDDDADADKNTEKIILPETLQLVVDRIRKVADKSGKNPIKQVIVEEYSYSQLSLHLNQSKLQATVFETAGTCSECCYSTTKTTTTKATGTGTKCDCYVACVPLTVSLIQNTNRPKGGCGEGNRWEKNHSTMMILPKSTLVVKRRDFLFKWRHRIVKTAPTVDDTILSTEQNQDRDSQIVLLKFYGVSKKLIKSTVPTNPDFGFVPTIQNKEEELRRRSTTMPKLKDLLTIIVTTSPIKSNPSTSLLENVFNTFLFCGDDFAYKCRKVIVCDGCRQRNGTTTKKHTNHKQSMRNGIVNDDQFTNYNDFKQALKRLCKEHDVTTASTENSILSPFCNTSVYELDVRQGYGFALKHALQELVTTPYVIVIQHDRTFMRPTPLKETIMAMWHNSRIKYVGMSMRSNLLYRDIFIGQYGRSYSEEMLDCVIRPPELTLDADKYGTEGRKLREDISIKKYYKSQQYLDHIEWIKSSKVPKNKCQLSLTPTFFWYDNIHICETKHYRDFIFDPQYKMVVQGGFVEDKLSPVIKRTVERLGLREGHSRFGCFLLDDHSGMFFVGHLDGGNYLTKNQKQELIDKFKSRDQKKMNSVHSSSS